MEIDLGDEVRQKNVEQTVKAKRILNGEVVEEEEVNTKPIRTRLGPDGKPWRSRRKRRGSDDMKRDQLVDSLMSENRCRFILFTLEASVCKIVDSTQWICMTTYQTLQLTKMKETKALQMSTLPILSVKNFSTLYLSEGTTENDRPHHRGRETLSRKRMSLC